MACRESAASDDPACLALRATRGESATSFRSVLTEYPTAYIDGVIDDWDRTRGACCERVRDSYRKTLQVQQHIAWFEFKPGSTVSTSLRHISTGSHQKVESR